MSQADHSGLITQRLRTIQIVAAVLLVAPIFMFVIALLTGSQGNRPQPAVPIVSYVGIVFAVVELLMFIIFPNWAAAAACRKVGREAGQVPIADLLDPLLCGIFQTRLIIGFAMLEGAAFLQAIAYMVEGQLFSLAIGLAL